MENGDTSMTSVLVIGSVRLSIVSLYFCLSVLMIYLSWKCQLTVELQEDDCSIIMLLFVLLCNQMHCNQMQEEVSIVRQGSYI